MKKSIFKINGRFYYGWVMLLCGFLTMFDCYVIKANCSSLFYVPICEDLGISRMAFTQMNTIMTITMLIGSLFIGKIYNKYPMKYVLTACIGIASICYLLMSRSTSLWQLYVLSGIQGFGWAGATNLPVTIMVSNWFGPKIKGTAMSIAMLGSGLGGLVWVKVINGIILNSGWRAGYLSMAIINAVMIIVALLLVVSMPIDKGFDFRIGDPSPEEAVDAVPTQKTGITSKQAIKTARWWFQWIAHFTTMIGFSAFATQCVAYFTDITGSADKASSIYSAALGTMIIGMTLLGILTDILHVKRTSVIAPMFFAGVFVCMILAEKNMIFATLLVPLYMIGGAVPGMIPSLITVHGFGDKEFGVLSGWMNMAGNLGQIVGPIISAFIFDVTGSYQLAWVIIAIVMVIVGLLYLASNLSSKKQIAEMGYTIQ